MEQNNYPNPTGMPQPNAQYPVNGQMPYGGMPYPQQNMPQGNPYPNQGGYPPRGNMNMPPAISTTTLKTSVTNDVEEWN